VDLERSTDSREAIVADIWLEFGLDTILTVREARKIILQKAIKASFLLTISQMINSLANT